MPDESADLTHRQMALEIDRLRTLLGWQEVYRKEREEELARFDI